MANGALKKRIAKARESWVYYQEERRLHGLPDADQSRLSQRIAELNRGLPVSCYTCGKTGYSYRAHQLCGAYALFYGVYTRYCGQTFSNGRPKPDDP